MELELSDEHGMKMMEEIDWEHMFDDVQFPEDAFDFVDAIPPASDVAGESWIGEIEQLLMKDADCDESHNQNSDVVDGFTLSDVLLDSPEQERQPSPEIIEKNSPCPSNTNSNTDLEANVNIDGDANLTDDNHNNTSPNFDFKADDAAEELNDSKEDDADDDPLSKKRKRQLRNRDAAMRSRERKKMYVKDLEVKSRYLEAECRRLGRLLQCCYAENQMLRISLQSGSTFAMAKPESAVLLLGMITITLCFLILLLVHYWAICNHGLGFKICTLVCLGFIGGSEDFLVLLFQSSCILIILLMAVLGVLLDRIPAVGFPGLVYGPSVPAPCTQTDPAKSGCSSTGKHKQKRFGKRSTKKKGN